MILSNEKYAINFSKVFENGTPKGLIIKTRVYMKLYIKYNLYQYVINIIHVMLTFAYTYTFFLKHCMKKKVLYSFYIFLDIPALPLRNLIE